MLVLFLLYVLTTWDVAVFTFEATCSEYWGINEINKYIFQSR